MKKALLASSILLASGLFVACKGPQPNADNIELKQDGYSQTTSSSPSTATTSTTTTLTVPTNQEGTMKTLADFETINATEVTLGTTKGDITFEIYTDKVPLTAQNFLNLAKSGYYDGIVFHRVIPDFMAQAGDPLSKDPSKKAMWGTGGPGYEIADEFDPSLKHDGPGIVSMANRGPNTGGSQFFITFEAQPHLDGKHAVFGKVTQGLDVLETITTGDVIQKVSFK